MKKLLSALIVALLVATSSFADEAAKDRIFVISDFSGGIATKLSDETWNPKYARIAENLRLNSAYKALTKRDQLYTYGTADATEAITSMHRLYTSSAGKYLIVTHGDEVEVGSDTTGAFTSILALSSGDYRWSWLTWHDLGIGGDGYNQPVKTDGSTATYLGTCHAKDNGAGAGPNGTYTYKVSFYTASYEVIFDVPSNSVTVADNDIDLTMIPIGPDTFLGEDVVGRKVYRNTVAAPATWSLLTNGTIANNTATTLTDSDADGDLGAAYPAGDATWTPPKGKLCIIHQNRLFIANNPTYPSRIYYSKDGSHDLFETSTDYFNIRANDGDEITFIENLLGILTIGKTNSIQKLYTNGDDPAADWEISDPYSTVGCDAIYSAVNSPIGILYLSRARSGIYVFNGQASTIKSEIVTPVINDILPMNLSSVCGEYNNNIYYMAYSSSSVGGSVNNRVLVYDVLGEAYTIDTLSIGAFCTFSGSSDGGVLYAGASDSGKVYQFSNVAKQIIHSKHSDFSGTFDDARYIPTDVGGDANSPILELAWDDIIDDLVDGVPTTINNLTGDVDRPDGSGTYTSPVITTTGASTYDKVYWNESLAAGTDATIAIRSGATAVACATAAWSGEYSSPSGSDISGLTANNYTQYRITLSSSDIDYTPYIITAGGFTVKIGYNTLGTASETAIAIHWQTGWMDFNAPGYTKELRKLIVRHEGTQGTLRITFTNEHGDTDYFDIDLSTHGSEYSEYFTNGVFTGKKIKIDVTNSDLNALKVKEIICVYDVAPHY